jgi:hypothetical protein
LQVADPTGTQTRLQHTVPAAHVVSRPPEEFPHPPQFWLSQVMLVSQPFCQLKSQLRQSLSQVSPQVELMQPFAKVAWSCGCAP